MSVPVATRDTATPHEPQLIRQPKRPRAQWALLAPALILLGALVGYPLVRLVIMSFQKYGAEQAFGAAPEWVGLSNYTKILGDSEFWIVLVKSLGFMVVCVFMTMLLGTLVALLMMRVNAFFKGLVSVAMLCVWGMPLLASTYIWGWIFDSQIGVLNYVLGKITGSSWDGHSWLANWVSFYWVASIIVVWGAVPFVAFTMYAGLVQIPGEVLEAASLDGATPVSRFRLIMIPYIRPVITVLLVLSIIWDLRVFTQIYALQGMGGIAADTNTLGTYIFQVAFTNGNYGMASAIAIIMVAILAGVSAINIRQTMKQEDL